MGWSSWATSRATSKRTPRARVIVTTEGRDDDFKRGLDAGASAYLRKPFTPEALDRSSARPARQAGPGGGQYVSRAEAPGPQSRHQDRRQTGPQSPESLTASLLEALGATDRQERARAIAGAAEMVDPDLLIEAVADQADSRRRNAAMDALATGGARSVPALVRGLRHPDWRGGDVLGGRARPHREPGRHPAPGVPASITRTSTSFNR